MENHNWTQPAQVAGGIQPIYQNPNAPYINSLVDGTSAISDQVAYANAYHNVLATATGANPHIHPSEPNYIWAEAGTNFGVLNDNDPYAATNPTNQNTSSDGVDLGCRPAHGSISSRESRESRPLTQRHHRRRENPDHAAQQDLASGFDHERAARGGGGAAPSFLRGVCAAPGLERFRGSEPCKPGSCSFNM